MFTLDCFLKPDYSTMVNMIYLLKKNKIINGPYTIEILMKRGVKHTDMVWYQGLADWTPIDKADFLKDIPRRAIKDTDMSFIKRVFSFLK